MPIYYEGRLAKLELSEAERPKIDPDFEEVTEGEEVERKEGLKSKWAQLAAVVGSEKRLKLVAADLVDIDPFARQLSLRYDRSISWRTATIGAWLPRIEIAAAPA